MTRKPKIDWKNNWRQYLREDAVVLSGFLLIAMSAIVHLGLLIPGASLIALGRLAAEKRKYGSKVST